MLDIKYSYSYIKIILPIPDQPYMRYSLLNQAKFA